MFELNYRTRVVFGLGARHSIGDILAAHGLYHPLVVTDTGVVKAGLLDDILAVLPHKSSTPIFSETPPNPTEAAVDGAIALYRNASCDCVIGFGGGSSIDCGKATALLVTHEGSLLEYGVQNPSPKLISEQVAPFIAVPTTAGTGSEVGRAFGVVANGEQKVVVLSEYLQPMVAVCDPELTLSLPLGLSAGTGLDAFSHCVEALLSPVPNPITGSIAQEGARLIFTNIGKLKTSPNDIDVRTSIMIGALMGGMSMVKGLGAAHAVAVPLDKLGLHHGTLVSVIMPHVMRFVAEAAGERMTKLCSVLGVADASALAEELTSLNELLGLPGNLRGMGVGEADLPPAAVLAAKSHFAKTSPRIANEDEYLSLLQAAW